MAKLGVERLGFMVDETEKRHSTYASSRRLSLQLHRLIKDDLGITELPVIQPKDPLDELCLKKRLAGLPLHIETKSDFHRTMVWFARSKLLNYMVLTVIVCNCVQLLLLAEPQIELQFGWYLSTLDTVFLAVYIIEMIIKMYALRRLYWKDKWNIFDFVIVVVTVFEFVIYLLALTGGGGFADVAIFRVLRLLRMLRAIRTARFLRAIRLISKLQTFMETVLSSVKQLGTISLLMIFFMYLFAVVGEGLYGDIDYRFTSLFRSIWTMFQLMTCDDWFYMIMALEAKGRPEIFVFAMIYIVILFLVFVSLLMAIVVDNFSRTMERLREDKKLLLECKRHEMGKARDDPNHDNFDLLDDDDSESDDDDFHIEHPLHSAGEFYKRVTSQRELDALAFHMQLMAAIDLEYFRLNRWQQLVHCLVDLTSDVSSEAV